MSEAMWNKLGLNENLEWIEEEKQTKCRRIKLPSGFIFENDTDYFRFGRIKNQEDLHHLIQILSFPDIFKSYKTIAQVIQIWCPQFIQHLNIFQRKFEHQLQSKIWDAINANKWSIYTPNWSIIQLNGYFDWPLWVDIGLYKRTGLRLSLNEYRDWLKNQLNTQQISIGLNLKKGFKINNWIVDILSKNYRTLQECSFEDWVGKPPTEKTYPSVGTEYIPFSDPKKTPSGYVEPLLNQAFQVARPIQSAENIQKSLSEWLKVSVNHLPDILSYDQMDAIYLATQKLMENKSFLLADETGYGKGRTLASLAKIALNKNYNVLFITEKKALFSDFYRDCSVVFSSVPLPIVIHNTAKIIQENNINILKSENKRLPENKDTWVWTTYSQFNRSNPEKLKKIISWMKLKPTWILLDEAQNAAGDSNTSEFLQKIQKYASGVVFSSATFVKNEQQLKAYKRLFHGTEDDWKRLESAFLSNSDILRSSISLEWAEQGVFLRREHPPIENPEAIWIKVNSEIQEQNHVFSNWWKLMWKCSKIWNLALQNQEGPWNRLGGHLNRSLREFSLLQKEKYLVEFIQKSIENHQKPVVVADWTLSSHVHRFIKNNEKLWKENTEEDDENIKINKTGLILQEEPLWKKSWMSIVDEIFPNDDIKKMDKSHQNEIQQIKTAIFQQLSKFPDWSISPFDSIKSQLKNISFNEISGRTWNLTSSLVNEEIQWKIEGIPPVNRSVLVNEFNQGDKQAIFITRAGNSGISLHAGQKFKNQEQRTLVEWDISPDPSVRIQFWGRVRRKDQVNEPVRSSLFIDTPFERRRQNRDQIKQSKLTSHSGKRSVYPDDNIIGFEGNFVSKEWIYLHPSAHALLMSGPHDVEKILSRSIILSEWDRESLLAQLQNGVSLLRNYTTQNMNWEEPSRIMKTKWWWGTNKKALYWQKRVWPSVPTATASEVFDVLSSHSHGQSETACNVITLWKDIWTKWWENESYQKIPQRVNLIKYWFEHISLFERGSAVQANDPLTKHPTKGIVLGWKGPDTLNPYFWNPSQIEIIIWLASMDKPISTSLSGWLSKEIGGLVPLSEKPSPSWFSGEHYSRYAMALVGSPWSISAWGARNAPTGHLVKLYDDYHQSTWGWTMPSVWGWGDMLNSPRELANVQHALSFMKFFPQDMLLWKWTKNQCIFCYSQQGKLFITGTASNLDCLTFPVLRRSSHIKWDEHQKNWTIQTEWKNVIWLFNYWISIGASPFVLAKYADWHQKTFAQFFKN